MGRGGEGRPPLPTVQPALCLRPEPVTDSATPAPQNDSPAPQASPAAKGPQATGAAAAAAPAAKPKPPAPEEQPFGQFVPQLLLPALAKEIQAYGGGAVELSFEQGPMPVVGSPCSMVKGTFPGGRRFWLCFTAEDIGSAKTIALAETGAEASLLESFLIDEKKMTLALLVSRVVSRLNGQKWLGAN